MNLLSQLLSAVVPDDLEHRVKAFAKAGSTPLMVTCQGESLSVVVIHRGGYPVISSRYEDESGGGVMSYRIVGDSMDTKMLFPGPSNFLSHKRATHSCLDSIEVTPEVFQRLQQ